MTWLASTSHMAVLSSLRNYLLTHGKQLWWRFGAMFVIATMLLVALGLTSTFSPTWFGNGVWYIDEPMKSSMETANSRLAKCAAPDSDGKGALESKLKLAIFLSYGYGSGS